jgi:GH24 family phage-related lysozyme (muramidase)
MIDRKPIFDATRAMLGRGFTEGEIAALDDAIDVAVGGGAAEAWIVLAAPLVERFEGMARLIPGDKVEAYPDPGTGGKPWTIGIGSTTDEYGKPIQPGDVWSLERARKRFEAHLAEFGCEVDKLIAGKPTTAPQKAALTSLAYNIGIEALSRSTVLKCHRAGDHEGAANAFSMWVKAGGKVLPGLVKRRAAEAQMYRSRA